MGAFGPIRISARKSRAGGLLLHILEERYIQIPRRQRRSFQIDAIYPEQAASWSLNRNVPPELTVKPDAADAAHPWWDLKAKQFLFFADALKRAIKARRMKARLLIIKNCGFAVV